MPLHPCAGTDATQGLWNKSGSPRGMRWFAGSEAEGEVRVQNADGSVEVQPDEEPWDGSPATSSSDVSTNPLPALLPCLKLLARPEWCTRLCPAATCRGLV